MKFSKVLMTVMVLTVALILVVACQKQQTPPTPTANPTPTDTKNIAEKKVVVEEDEQSDSLTGGAVVDISPESTDEDVVEFKITAKELKFDPSVIYVRKGQKVRLYVTAEDRDYGFSLAEFYIKKFVREGETVTVDFTADKQGTFIFFSRIEWNNGRIGELGRLVVSLY